jgi:hypothetical protein
MIGAGRQPGVAQKLGIPYPERTSVRQIRRTAMAKSARMMLMFDFF